VPDDIPNLTPTQVYALIVLMAEARVVDNKRLQELAGFTLTGKDRARLNDLGLVETSGSRRLYAHQLSDKGWRLMRENIHNSVPHKQGGSALRSMYTLLANLHRSLDRLQVPYAEFFKQTAPEPTAPEPTAPEPTAPEPTAPEPTAPEPTAAETTSVDREPENAIRAAYRELSSEPGEWIGLADLRERLPGLDRGTVDAALRSMARQPDVHIIPVANVKSLKDRDRAAALRIGMEDNHALAIEPA
jgi:hypothetical protein